MRRHDNMIEKEYGSRRIVIVLIVLLICLGGFNLLGFSEGSRNHRLESVYLPYSDFSKSSIDLSSTNLQGRGKRIDEGILSGVYTDELNIYLSYGMDDISYISMFSNGSFTNNYNIAPISEVNAPTSMTLYKNISYLFYTSRANNTLFYLYSSTESGWIRNNIEHTEKVSRPKAIVFNGQLHIFCIEGSTFNTQEIGFFINNSSGWSKFQKIGSTDHPFIYSIKPLIYQNNLYLFYTALDYSDSGRSVYFVEFDGEFFSKPIRLTDKRDHQHLRDVFIRNSKLYITWIRHSDFRYEGKSFDGITWSETKVLDVGGKIISYEDMEYLISIENNTLKISRFNLDTWNLEEPIIHINIDSKVYNKEEIVFASKLWIFYYDGEHIRYFTYDGYILNYEPLEYKPSTILDTLVTYWWLAAFAAMATVALWSYLSKHKRESKEETPFDREMGAEELSEFLSRRKEKE